MGLHKTAESIMASLGALSNALAAQTDGLPSVIADRVCLSVNQSVKGMIETGLGGFQKASVDIVDELKRFVEPINQEHTELVGHIQLLTGLVQSLNTADAFDHIGQTVLVKIYGLFDQWAKNHETTLGQVTDLDKRLEVSVRDAIAQSTQQSSVIETLKTLPGLTKGVLSDLLIRLDSRGHEVINGLRDLKASVRDAEARTVSASRDNVCSTNGISSRLESLEKVLVRTAHNSSAKGKEGEDKLFDLLCNRL
jgi:hypothetical protein